MSDETGIIGEMGNWKPQVIIPSTVLLASLTTEQLPLAFALDWLCYPSDLKTEPYWASEFGNSVLWWRHYVIGEFCRQLLDSKFPLFPLPKRNRDIREVAKATATLWLKTWECLERLNSLGFLKISPALALSELVKENAFAMPFLFSDDLEKPMTGEYLMQFSKGFEHARNKHGKQTRPGGNPYIKAIQLENQMMLTLEGNPFPESFTRNFIKVCQAVANQSDQFRRTRYTPMVRDRMSLVTVLRAQKAKTFGAVQENRGRYRNKRQREGS